VQDFFEFCNFYKRFIKNFSKIVKLLIKLTRKNVSLVLNEICKNAFDLLKKKILDAFILTHFDLSKQSYIENNSFNFVNVNVLSQMRNDDKFHSITFFSNNLASTKCNYEIYDKKLLVIIKYFEQ
jgi:hypothetical protein